MHKEAYPTLEQIAAAVRIVFREEMDMLSGTSISKMWLTEKEVLMLCGKSRRTLYRAIDKGRIQPSDILPNPIGSGYLFRRSAIIKP